MDDTRHTLDGLVQIIQTHTGRGSRVFRPPLPIQPVYPMDQLEIRLSESGSTAHTPKISRKSMFFKVSKTGMDQDPFLQRLSRLQ